MFIGYRDYIVYKANNNDTKYSPDGACDISWQTGREMAEKDCENAKKCQAL